MYLVDKNDFVSHVLDTNNTGKPLVIDFTATWCPPCKMIGPIYEGLVANYPELTMKKVDVDANPKAAEAAVIKSMPTFKVYQNGEEIETMSGANQEGLVALLERAKAAAG